MRPTRKPATGHQIPEPRTMTTAIPTPQLRPHTPTCLTWRTPKNGKQQALSQNQVQITCLTRLREAGMSLEAVQAQAGHRNIESTRIYLHLSNTWLAEQYHQAITALDDALTGTNEAR